MEFMTEAAVFEEIKKQPNHTWPRFSLPSAGTIQPCGRESNLNYPTPSSTQRQQARHTLKHDAQASAQQPNTPHPQARRASKHAAPASAQPKHFTQPNAPPHRSFG
jgi:hypothetical protein